MAARKPSAKHRAPVPEAESDDPRRPGPKHSADSEPPRKRRAPTKRAAQRSAPPAPGPRATRREARMHNAGQAAREYANRQAFKATTGKPSVVGRATAGAAAGAATGLAVGGPVGAAVGGAVGGVGGGVGGARAKKAYKAAERAANGATGARRIIVAEFAICAVVVALSPLTDAAKQEKPGAWMKRMSAVMGVFLVLALVSAAGRGPARAAAGFGGLVALVLAISDRNLFARLAEIFNSTNDKAAEGSHPITDDVDVQQDFVERYV